MAPRNLPLAWLSMSLGLGIVLAVLAGGQIGPPGDNAPAGTVMRYVRLSSLTSLLRQAGKPDVLFRQGQTKPAGSATGVTADTVGSVAPEDPPEGVQAVPPPAGQSVKILGVEGSEGIEPPQENTVRSVTNAHGAIQSIPGIEGIDTVTLENLEAVLRIQQRATEPCGQGGARTAAALMATDQAPQEPEEMTDARQEHLELEMEGS